MSYKVVVPVKRNSKRLINKNFRPFYMSDSLFDLRMKKLLDVFDNSLIYVSSEDPSVESEANKYKVNFVLREEKLTLNEIGMSEVVEKIADQIDLKHDEDLIWSQVTEPFFDSIAECVKIWESEKENYDSLVVVQRMGNFLLDEKGMPYNFNYGVWHRPSQELKLLYVLPFTFMIIKAEAMRMCRYYIGQKPYLHQYKGVLFDIDDELDFNNARKIYEIQHSK